MSGGWLKFYGWTIHHLEDCVSHIQNKKEYNQDPWTYKPLECVESELEKLVDKYKFLYLVEDKEKFQVEYTDKFTIKDHWKRVFREKLPVNVEQEYDQDYLKHQVNNQVKREFEPDITLENFTI